MVEFYWVMVLNIERNQQSLNVKNKTEALNHCYFWGASKNVSSLGSEITWVYVSRLLVATPRQWLMETHYVY